MVADCAWPADETSTTRRVAISPGPARPPRYLPPAPSWGNLVRMTKEQLTDLLVRLELTRDGDVFRPPPGLGIVVSLGLDREPLVIDRVTKIEVPGQLVIVTAQRKD